jgi:hypothetical protein
MKMTGAGVYRVIKNHRRRVYRGAFSFFGMLFFFLLLGLIMARAKKVSTVTGGIESAEENAVLDSVTSKSNNLPIASQAANNTLNKAISIDVNILWRLEMAIDFGRDYGQNLGTLFELFDANGKVLCGAGFNSSVQTRVAINNRMLEFYCRLPDRDIRITDLGKPDQSFTRPVINQVDNTLMDFASERAFRNEYGWGTASYPSVKGDILNIQMVRNEPLYFLRDELNTAISYRGKRITIVTEPLSTLYYDKNVYILGRDSGLDEVYLYWFEWDGYASEQYESVEIHRVAAPPELTEVYALYGYEGKLLIAGSGSYLFEFSDGEFKIVPPDQELLSHIDSKKSGELYSFITYFDKVLIGHYPSGLLLKYGSYELTTIQNSPPLVEDEWQSGATYYREAQSLAIYGGDLYVGMYPWGRVFRLDRDTNQWGYYRPFEHPQIMAGKFPYADTCPKAEWAQRITYLTPYRGSLAAGMGSMRANPQQSENPVCIPEEAFEDYGRVELITAAASTMGQLKWTDEVVNIEFIARVDGLDIYQDGEEIAHTRTSISREFFEKTGQIEFGYGIYGPINGTILSTTQ